MIRMNSQTNQFEPPRRFARLTPDQLAISIVIATGFWLVASSIVMLRENVVPFRPGQYVSHDIVSRVAFVLQDTKKLTDTRNKAWKDQACIFTPTADVWVDIQKALMTLPEQAAKTTPGTDDDAAVTTRLRQYAIEPHRSSYEAAVKEYVKELRDLKLVIVSDNDRQLALTDGRIELRPGMEGMTSQPKDGTDLLTLPLPDQVATQIHDKVIQNFVLELQPRIYRTTMDMLRPTHACDESATVDARNHARELVSDTQSEVRYPANIVLVSKDKGEISADDWQLLKAEHEFYIKKLGGNSWKSRLGVVGSCFIITAILCGYCSRYQPKLLRNHLRAFAMAGLLIVMLLLTQLAGIGTSTLYFFGVAPTVLAALILCIAYDQRFAIGVGTILGVMVTLALNQSISFFLILWSGVLTGVYLLDDIRTRSKLVEVGVLTGAALMLATGATGAIALDPFVLIGRDCLFSGAAGLVVGFAVLGVLPFIEKAFRITTSMTLLEMADINHPLLRRLATEAPGTYNHSLQVATLSEAAANAIGANSLLCRVAAYYHDVGKIKKADYFVENQHDNQNKHMNLSPSVSILIILGHVKDGIELAKEYNLPTSILPFIQQHHGTTLVEFFYHAARTKTDPQHLSEVSETQYRYPGPKPRTRETAILMMADAAESACRAMHDPTPARVESLVHDLSMKRFLDGQFDECDLTMRELELIERSLVKGLLAIYHGRIAYPSTQQIQNAAGTGAAPSIKSA
jgi:cyclic-di-AMP phosphodiesterase PgpH